MTFPFPALDGGVRCVWFVASAPGCCYWPWKRRDVPKKRKEKKRGIFVNNALRHLGYENTRLHRRGT